MNWNTEILTKLTPAHKEALGYNLVGQGVAFLLGSTVLDGGGMAMMVLIAAIGYWIACGIILSRRYSNLRAGDLFIFRWGFLAGCLLAIMLAPLAGVRVI